MPAKKNSTLTASAVAPKHRSNRWPGGQGVFAGFPVILADDRSMVRIAKRFAAMVLVMVGVYCGLIAFFSDEPWADNAVVRYGGAILAWGLAGGGVALWGSTAVAPEDGDEDAG
jgi:hypothetical protein